MKTTIRHGSVLKCDIVTVNNDGTEHTDKCQVRFVSYSMSGVLRAQAAGAGWQRASVSRVRWPGQPPMEGSKKVDVCPDHEALVISVEEAAKLRAAQRAKEREQRKVERAAARADAKAKKKQERDAERERQRLFKRKRKPKAVAHV